MFPPAKAKATKAAETMTVTRPVRMTMVLLSAARLEMILRITPDEGAADGTQQSMIFLLAGVMAGETAHDSATEATVAVGARAGHVRVSRVRRLVVGALLRELARRTGWAAHRLVGVV